MSEIKTRLLSPALTSHFQCSFEPKDNVISWIREKNLYLSDKEATPGEGLREDNINLTISCCDATLPGSTFQTHEVMAYTGVNERFAYMRAYDDRSDFTFYVNDQYQQLKYFEGWSSYIADEQYDKDIRGGVKSKTYNYRMNFPDGKDGKGGYRGTIRIKKFERSFGGEKTKNNPRPAGRTLEYTFVDAYPISIASIPVSYNSSELLKCTVSFTYSRYYLESNALGGITLPNASSNQGTTPTSQGLTPQTIGRDIFNTTA